MMTIIMNRRSVLIVARLIRSIAPAVKFLQKTSWAILGEFVCLVNSTGQQARSTPSRAYRSNRAATRELDLFPEADIQS
jgi:hypothetical protein